VGAAAQIEKAPAAPALLEPEDAGAVGMSTPSRIDLKQARILIADDNPKALDILSQVLMGFAVRHVIPCHGGAEVIDRISRESADLLIIDGEMPEHDGIDVTLHVRSHPEGPNFTAPILIVSGFTPIHMVTRARDAGANWVITKPIIPRVLLNRIEWLAKSPRPFITSPNYCGPDRRFQNLALPEGVEERRAEAIRLMAQPDRVMRQDEIDSVFD